MKEQIIYEKQLSDRPEGKNAYIRLMFNEEDKKHYFLILDGNDRKHSDKFEFKDDLDNNQIKILCQFLIYNEEFYDQWDNIAKDIENISIVKPSKITKKVIEKRNHSLVKWELFKNSKSKQGIEALKGSFPNWNENHIDNVSIVLYFLYLTIEDIETLDIIETIETIEKITIRDSILLFSFLPSNITNIQKGIDRSSTSGISNYIKGEKGKEGLLEQKLIELINPEKKEYQTTEEGKKQVLSIFKERIDYLKRNKAEEKILQEIETKTTNFIENFKDFIENEVKSSKNGKIIINFQKLNELYYDSAEYLIEKPHECFEIIKIAIREVYDKQLPFEIIKLANTQLLKIGELRSKHLNQLIKIRGTVSSLSDVKPQITMSLVQCPNCCSSYNVIQKDNKLKEPKGCKCGFKGKLTVVSNSLDDLQRMKVEELSEELDGRSEARKLNVILRNHLTKYNIQPMFESSNKIELIGVLEEKPQEKKGSKQTTQEYFFNVNSINMDGWKEDKITQKELEQIKEVSEKKNLLNELAQNIAPHIFGLDFEKLGMLIGIVSGGDPTKITKGNRDDIHVLFVGDPSVGKSQLMQFGHDIYPRSRWVSGNSATGVGLIGSVINDEFLQQPTVSKGALALANHHVVFLDELDKMSDASKDSLHNAMEDQFAAIDKWNKHTKFQTDTTLIASMNPIKSKFTNEIEMRNQVDLAQTIKDRFDLIFVIKDNVDAEKDEKLIMKILEEHNEESKGSIDKELFRKYIGYSRTLKPTLSKESQIVIAKAFIDLRKKHSDIMTPRQAKGIIRITMAACKLRLSEITTKQDAELAVNLIRYCLMQQGLINEIIKPIEEEIEEIKMEKKSIKEDIQSIFGDMKSLETQYVVSRLESIGYKTQDIDKSIENMIKFGDLTDKTKNGYLIKLE